MKQRNKYVTPKTMKTVSRQKKINLLSYKNHLNGKNT